MRDLTVIGAGIGGLACALALARRGAGIRVLERSPELGEVGAGIQISPNGVRVLESLGCGDALRAASLGSGAVLLADGPTGREVIRMPLGSAPYRLIQRPALVALLADALRDLGGEIVLGRAVALVEDGAPPRIDGEPTGFVVGADGLHSIVRPVLNGSAPPRFTGQTAWRATVPGDIRREARIDMGPGRHLVRYPLPGCRVNLVGVVERPDWAEEGWQVAGDPEAFRAAFAGFPAARAHLAAVTSAHLWGLFRHPVAERWHGTSLAILGDAAHPTLPFLAQGANLALEDAWTLAAALARGDLAAWQAARRPRAVRAIDAATANARNYHLAGPARLAAHAGLRALGAVAPGLLARRFDWLYGHDVTRA